MSYKNQITALIHNPDIIGDSILMDFDTKNDPLAEKGVTLLQQSGITSRNDNYTDWQHHYPSVPPHIKNLLLFIKGGSLPPTAEQEIDSYPEARYLKQLYETVPPDEELKNLKPMFGGSKIFDLEIAIETSPGVYFDDIGTLGARLTCKHCRTTTYINARNRYRFKNAPFIEIEYEFQCQQCGALRMGTTKDKHDILSYFCSCGGEYRQDKPILCPNCLRPYKDD